MAAEFDSTVFDIAANEINGNLRRTIETLGERYQTAGDFGCGVGATTALLSNHFDDVVGVDFAEKLLSQARKRVTAKNVRFIKADLTRKAELFKVGASFCFNALIHPASKQRERIARSVFQNTETGGVAVFVVPSLESFLRTYQTLIECRVIQGCNRKKTVRSVSRSVEKHVGSLVEGICDVGGTATKHFMYDEIALLLSGAGFEVTSIDRVEFPWDEELDDTPEWLGRPYPWDWMITADT